MEAIGSFLHFIELTMDDQQFTSFKHYIVKVYRRDTDTESELFTKADVLPALPE